MDSLIKKMSSKTLYFILMLSCYFSCFSYADINSYSVGGMPADILDFPYQVSIQYSFYGHVCGGVIISDTWILTTARCVVKFDPTELSVIVGTTSLDDEDPELHSVVKVIIHEDFDGSPLPDNDIALLEVEPLLALGSPGVQKIDLPDQDFKPSGVVIACNFTGWGAKVIGGDIPWDLQVIDQYLFNFRLCNATFYLLTSIELPETTLCTINDPTAISNGPCSGEWGSPLACTLDSHESPLLLGLLSGDPLMCGRAPFPNFFTKVSAFRDWVDQNTIIQNIV